MSRSGSVSSFFGNLLKSFRSEPEGEETLRDTLGLGDSVIDTMYDADWNSTGETSKSCKANRGRSEERGPERKKKAKPQRPKSAPVLDVSRIVLQPRGADTPDFGTPQQSSETPTRRSSNIIMSNEPTKLSVVDQITCQPCGGLGSFLAEVAKGKTASKTRENIRKSEIYRSDASTVATSGSSNDGSDSSRSGGSNQKSDMEEEVAWRTDDSIGGTLLNIATCAPGENSRERPHVPLLDFSKLKPPEKWQNKRPQTAPPVRTASKALVPQSWETGISAITKALVPKFWESGSSAGSSDTDIDLRLQRCLSDMAGCSLPEVADDYFDIPSQKVESSGGSTFRSFPIEDDYFEPPAPQQDLHTWLAACIYLQDHHERATSTTCKDATAAKQDIWPALLEVAL